MKTKKLLALGILFIALVITSAYIIPSLDSQTSAKGNLVSVLSDSTDSKTYVCPMHPEITSNKPGQCSKCGMDLVLKTDENKEQGMKCGDMKDCKDKCNNMENCKDKCNMENCKGCSGSNKECPMMKEHKHDDSKEQKHKKGCKGC